ncbi:unnamed protein product, partial [Mesorhabditis belari]|uniref:Uncharacterized protein n=1 Tax=Mesorhabditis belari TaxID=2138241 RepID=A0AAF3F8M7_9BILA
MILIFLCFSLLGVAFGGNEAQRCVRSTDCARDWECQHGFCTDTKLVTIAGDCQDPNEDWVECARTCEPTCSDTQPKCEMDCSHSGCVCRKNYVRSSNGQCVRQSNCPPKASKSTTNDHCIFDSQCPSGFACGHGFCSPLPQDTSTKFESIFGCSTTSDCPDRDFCRSRKCVKTGQQDGRQGEQCSASFDCESPLNCDRGVCKAAFSSSPFSAPHSQSTTGGIGSMRDVFPGEKLRRKSGIEIYPEMLDNALVAMFFSNSWSPAGQLFYQQFKKFFKDLERQGKNLEVVYIGVEDQNEQDYKRFVDLFPSSWIILPYRWAKTREVMGKFGVKGLPHIPLAVDLGCRKDRDCDAGLLCGRFGHCVEKDKEKREEGEVCEWTHQCANLMICANAECKKIRH